MKSDVKVAVTSRSFSRNPELRAELLERYENVTFNDKGVSLTGSHLAEFLKGHEKAITALEKIDGSLLKKIPELKVIGKYGVGLDMIDFDAMRKHGVKMGWRAGVNRRSVSELVLAFSIVMLRHVPSVSREVIGGVWQQKIGGLLSGRTVGIIGCGNVGKDLVTLLKPFNCKICVYDIVEYKAFYDEHDIKVLPLDELLALSDIVTLHVPLDDSTSNMINKTRMSLMKPSAVLINTARGGLVDEEALKCALIKGRLSAAAFDVFSVEPPEDDSLIMLPNFLATPHIGGSAKEAILAMGRAAIDGLDDYAEV